MRILVKPLLGLGMLTSKDEKFSSYQLTGSMGITGQMDHPDTIAALDKYRKTCAAHGKSAGMHIVRPNPQNIGDALDRGYTLIALGVDTVFLDDGVTDPISAPDAVGVACAVDPDGVLIEFVQLD